jgi:Mg2+ and Co2+ transporter CorA
VALPIYLVTGYFGMNFPNLPLVHRPFSLAYLNAGLAIFGLLLLWWFKRRRWF